MEPYDRLPYKIVVQNRHAKRIDWSSFYNPDQYHLVIITHPISARELLNSCHKHYFYRILEANPFEYQAIYHVIKTFIEKENLKGNLKDKLMVATNDEQALTLCALIREKLNLSGDRSSQINKFRNKISMKEILIDKGLVNLIPKFLLLDKKAFDENPINYVSYLEKYIYYPIFAKPISGGACRGIKKITDSDSLMSWCKEVNKDDFQYELDQFIVGDAFYLDSIIKNNKIEHFFVNKYITPCAEFFEGKPLAVIPILPENPDYAKFQNFNDKIIHAFSPISDGCTHLELIKKSNNDLYFLEIAARSPGAAAPDIYKRWTGIDIREAQLKLQLALPYKPILIPGPYGAFIDFPIHIGTIKKINLPSSLKSEFEINWKHPYKIGDTMKEPTDLVDYFCSIVLWNENYEDLINDVAMLHKHAIYETS